MQRKHNKDIVPTAKMLRKNISKEEKHFWYDFLCTYPVRFSRQKVLGRYIADFSRIRINSYQNTKYGNAQKLSRCLEYIDHLVEQSLSQLR